MLTKDFDDYSADVAFSQINTLTPVPKQFVYRGLVVKEDQNTNKTTCSYEVLRSDIEYPSINLANERKNGKFVQFLEPAFEWQGG